MSNQFPEQLSNPTIESTLRQWHEYDGLHRLVGTVCNDCGKKFFPKRFVCANCHSLNVLPYQFSGKGVIVNFDYQFLPPVKMLGFREELNRVMIVVKLEEGPTVVSELVDVSNPDEVKNGAEVHMVIRKIARSNNSDYKYAYKFEIEP